MKSSSACLTTAILSLVVFLQVPPARAQQVIQSDPVKFDLSQPLNSMRLLAPESFERKPHIVRPLPRLKVLEASRSDTVLQTRAPIKLQMLPPQGFSGIGADMPNFRVTGAPADTNGAAGETQFVEWVNTSLAVFDKQTGRLIYGPASGRVLWKGFGGKCETENDGDPIVQYDKIANRWVLTQFAVSGGSPYFQCIAVSRTSDATGEYARYAYKFDDFNDYPKFGVWPDAYYAAFNMFGPNNFLGGRACAFDRGRMLSGQAAKMQCFQVAEGGLLPADLDGSVPPPNGAPGYFVALGSGTLKFWEFHVNWNAVTQSSVIGPKIIQVAPFRTACSNSRDVCIPQPHTSQKLSGLSDRLMYRFAYRNFGNHESFVVNHSVSVDGPPQRAGIRWYELRNPATPQVFQQGTYSPDSASRWIGSIAMDKVGNIAMGYSISSSAVFPSIRYTGRSENDPANQMAGELLAQEGKGAQQPTLDRWGDYSSISLDPTDDCTFWFTTEYIKSDGSYNWDTFIFRTKFPDCH